MAALPGTKVCAVPPDVALGFFPASTLVVAEPVAVAIAFPFIVPVTAPAVDVNGAREITLENPFRLNVKDSSPGSVNAFPGKLVTGSVPSDGKLSGFSTVSLA